MQRTFPGNWLRAHAFFFFLFDDRAIKINFCLLFGEALGLALQLTKRRSKFVSRRRIFKAPGDGEELWNKLLSGFVYFLPMPRAPKRLLRLTNTLRGVFATTPLHARQIVGACFAFEELSETRHDHSIELFQRFAKLFWARPTNEEKPPDRFVIRKLRADWGETWSLQFISYGNSIAKFFILLLWCSLSVVVQKNRAVLCLKKFKHSHTDFRKAAYLHTAPAQRFLFSRRRTTFLSVILFDTVISHVIIGRWVRARQKRWIFLLFRVSRELYFRSCCKRIKNCAQWRSADYVGLTRLDAGEEDKWFATERQLNGQRWFRRR